MLTLKMLFARSLCRWWFTRLIYTHLSNTILITCFYPCLVTWSMLVEMRWWASHERISVFFAPMPQRDVLSPYNLSTRKKLKGKITAARVPVHAIRISIRPHNIHTVTSTFDFTSYLCDSFSLNLCSRLFVCSTWLCAHVTERFFTTSHFLTLV